MARLVVESGTLEHDAYPVDQGVTLGRERHNAIPMPSNRRASRDHCKVWQEGPKKYAVADLGSTNGTLVNDEPITRASLKDGDRIRVGDVVFRFELEEEEKPAPVTKPQAPRPDLATVLRGEAPLKPPPGTGAPGGVGDLEVKQRVLQYHKKRRGGSALGWDLSQMAGPTRWILVILAVGVAVVLFLVASGMLRGS